MALCSGALLVVLVVVVGLVIPAAPLAIDERWSELMRHIQSSVLRNLALVFDHLGRGLARILLSTTIGLALAFARRWPALLAFAAAESLTPLANLLVKLLVDRPRPPDGMLHVPGPSFPSGHASYAGATAVALVLLFSHPGTRRLIWWLLAGLAIAGMAWSRTYLQVHWLSDVLAGALLGIGIALVSFATAQIVSRRHAEPPTATSAVRPRSGTGP